MGVHDDAAGLCLTEDTGEAHHGDDTRVDDVSEHVASTDTRQLVHVAYKQEAHVSRDGLQQGVHQYDVNHRAFVDDECVALQRVLVVALVALGRVELQQPVNGLGLHASGFGHALGGSAGGCGKEDVHSHLFESGDDAVLGGCLASSRTARKHHNLVVNGGVDGLGLKVIIGDAGLLADSRNVGLFLEHLLLSGGEQRFELVGGTDLTEIERWQVDGLVLSLQVFSDNHLAKGGLNGNFVGFQELYSGFQELVAMSIDMAFVGQLVEGVENTAATSSLVVFAVAHLRGDGVGGLEADAPNIIGKAVGILLHLVDAFFAIGFVDLRSIGGADSIALKEHHHVFDVELLHPRVGRPPRRAADSPSR